LASNAVVILLLRVRHDARQDALQDGSA